MCKHTYSHTSKHTNTHIHTGIPYPSGNHMLTRPLNNAGGSPSDVRTSGSYDQRDLRTPPRTKVCACSNLLCSHYTSHINYSVLTRMANTHTHMPTRKHTYTHIHSCTHTYTHKHSCIHTHTHTGTAWSCASRSAWLTAG